MIMYSFHLPFVRLLCSDSCVDLLIYSFISSIYLFCYPLVTNNGERSLALPLGITYELTCVANRQVSRKNDRKKETFFAFSC